jgi:uncharacterized protein YjcR
MKLYTKNKNKYYVELVPEKELARRLGIQQSTLRSYRSRDQRKNLKYIKIDGHVYYIIDKKENSYREGMKQ